MITKKRRRRDLGDDVDRRPLDAKHLGEFAEVIRRGFPDREHLVYGGTSPVRKRSPPQDHLMTPGIGLR